MEFESDPIARALADGEEHGYARGAREEGARIKRALLKDARANLHSAIFAETQSKPRHLCDYEEAATKWLRAALDRIILKEK